jgi:hypothetical protein
MWKRPRQRTNTLGLSLATVVACIAVQTLAAAEHHGQVTFGGLPVPGATVTASQGEKKLTAVTDPQGAYSFKDLADGAWTMHVEMLCFAPIQQEVGVAAGAPASEWQLKLLPLDDLKAAAAAAPSVAMPAPAPATVSIAKPEAPPTKAAAKGKSKKGVPPPASAAAGQAGFQRTDVNASANANPNAFASEPSGPVTADQARNASDVFAINGSVNNAASSSFSTSPAFGNNRRGMRSLYQAALGLTWDNAAWDAQSFSLTGQSTPKPAYNLLQGTASFGGPIRIPRLFKQSSPNLFFGYQWIRNRNASVQSGLVPDAAQREGDLSHTLNPLGLPVQVFDPTTGSPYPGNVIPRSQISRQASTLLNYYPLPNFTSGRYNYQIPVVGGLHQDGLQLNTDKTITRKNQISGNFAYQHTASDSPSIFGFTDRTNSAGLSTGVNWSHRFSQRLYARLGYRFSRLSSRTTPHFANSEDVAGLAGITGNNRDPLYWGPPHLSFSSGITGLNDGQPSFPRNQTSGIVTDNFWNRGPHNVRFGGEFRRQQSNLFSQQNARGSFGFTGAAAGSDLAGFLLGVPDTSSIAFGNADKYFRSAAYTLYATDDYRVNSSLTVNAGLRWEYGSPITELYGRLVNLDIVPGFLAVAPVISSTPAGALTGEHYPDSLVRPDKHGVQPRIGIAWRPLPASSMVIRAGYGVYYNTSVYSTLAGEMAQQSPLSKSLSVQGTKDHPLSMANGFNASPSITPNTFAIDPNFRVGYAQNWDVSIQRDLPGALVVTAMYLGIKGTRAQQEFLPNTFPTGAGACITCPTGFAYVTSNGNSTREAGQLAVRRRMHNGIAANLQYTYAKAIDNAALGGKGQGTAVIAQDWLNLAGERGLSNFDQRHLLTLQAQYSTGMGVGGGTLMSGWRGAAFKEWTLSTQINAGSGLPQTPIYVAAVQGTGVTGSIRPSYTGASLYDAPQGFALNPAAVVRPAAGQWGNAGRNSITGPAQFSLDGSLSRTFRLGDRLNADLRLEATNALNHVTYQSWNTNINNAQFGLPTAANKMRMARMNIRVRF